MNRCVGFALTFALTGTFVLSCSNHSDSGRSVPSTTPSPEASPSVAATRIGPLPVGYFTRVIPNRGSMQMLLLDDGHLTLKDQMGRVT